VVGLICLVGLIAAWRPACKAASIDPARHYAVSEYFEMGYVKVHVLLGHSAKFACGRQPGHAPVLGVTSGWAVTREQSLEMPIGAARL